MKLDHLLLENTILCILHNAGKELPMRDIEQRIQQQSPQRLDTFEIRDAVWRLVHRGQIDFTLLRDLKLTCSSAIPEDSLPLPCASH